MNSNKFVFGVLVYNQEKIVVETLESIKHQILRFGNEMQCDLIVADDASTDSTVYIVKKWILDNKNVFNNTTILENTINRGTCSNYRRIIDLIDRNEKFKIIAGDDVFGINSIFIDCKYKKDYIITHPYIKLTENGIKSDRKHLILYYFNKITKTKFDNKKMFMYGNYLHTPSVSYSKETYLKSNCESFNRRFNLFEDDPTFYMMYKNTRQLETYFCDKPIVLYRYTNNSTSTTPNKNFINEWKVLQSEYYYDSNGIRKLYFYFRKNSNASGRIHIYKFIDYVMYIYKILFVMLYDYKGYKEFYLNYKKCIIQTIEYYNNVKEKNIFFLNNIGITYEKHKI